MEYYVVVSYQCNFTNIEYQGGFNFQKKKTRREKMQTISIFFCNLILIICSHAILAVLSTYNIFVFFSLKLKNNRKDCNFLIIGAKKICNYLFNFSGWIDLSSYIIKRQKYLLIYLYIFFVGNFSYLNNIQLFGWLK